MRGYPKDSDSDVLEEVVSPMILQRPEIVIARSLGILCIAGGFIIGMQGLDHPDSLWMPTALGLIVTGLMAQIFALLIFAKYSDIFR